MPARSVGVRSACPTCQHPSYSHPVGRRCVPVAKAGGKGSRAAKAPLAIGAGCGADELARRRNRDQGLVSGVQAPSCPNSPLDSRSFSASRFIRPADPYKRSPVSTSSISTIRPFRRPTALMACTRNLPSLTNHDTSCWATLTSIPGKRRVPKLFVAAALRLSRDRILQSSA